MHLYYSKPRMKKYRLILQSRCNYLGGLSCKVIAQDIIPDLDF